MKKPKPVTFPGTFADAQSRVVMLSDPSGAFGRAIDDAASRPPNKALAKLLRSRSPWERCKPPPGWGAAACCPMVCR